MINKPTDPLNNTPNVKRQELNSNTAPLPTNALYGNDYLNKTDNMDYLDQINIPNTPPLADQSYMPKKNFTQNAPKSRKMRSGKNIKNSTQKPKPSDFRLLNATSPFYFQEAYNSLRTNLKSMFVNNMYQKIIVTSAIPNEGKSNITINLGISLATDGSKVLIMDCDLRKPSVNQYLKIPKGVSAGLVKMLQAPTNVFDEIVYFEDLGIDVLVAGSPPPNPSELLGSENMRTIIEQVEPYYDYILFDTPPVGVVTDAAVLSRFTDGSLLVIKQNSATFNQAKRAKVRLEAVGCAIIGCILNDFNLKTEQDDTYAYYYMDADDSDL